MHNALREQSANSRRDPLVSIVIPVYNGLNFIRQAVESVLAQTYRNIEIVVVDDGSDDADLLVETLKGCTPEVRIICQEHSGIAAALNRGLSEMRGSLFCWLSHDDLFHPEKIESEVAAYRRTGEQSVIYSDYCYIDDVGRVLGRRVLTGPPPRHMYPFLLQDTWIHGCAMMIPKSVFETVGGFNERLQTTQDYDLYFRVADTFPFAHVPRVLVAVRLHKQQTTHTLSAVATAEQDRLYRDYLGRARHTIVEEFCGGATGRFYRYLYKRYTLGKLPRAAAAARRLSFTHAESTISVLRTAVTLLFVNSATAIILRPLVQIMSRRKAHCPVDTGIPPWVLRLSRSNTVPADQISVDEKRMSSVRR